GGEPGVLPVVRHGKDIFAVEMHPIMVPAVLTSFRGRGLGGVSLQPVLDHIAVELLVPEHTGKSLALDVPPFLAQALCGHVVVEGISFCFSLLENAVKVGSQASAIG